MIFQRGQDVWVEFSGHQHRGEVIEHNGAWVLCRIHADPAWDYGTISARLDPTPTVCVREKHVQPAELH